MRKVLIGLAIIFGALFLGVASAFGKGSETLTGNANFDQKLELLVRGIALAEGGWDRNLNPVPGTRPNRNNNPGDLEEAGDLGRDAGGYGVYSSADFAAAKAGTVSSTSDGFAALFHQAKLILTGTSHIYRTNWTWAQVAQEYDKGGDALTDWLPNVQSIAGMDPQQTVEEWLNQ